VNKISISPGKIAAALTAIVTVLTVTGVAGQYYKEILDTYPSLLKVVDSLNPNGASDNLLNWYQSSTLLFSSFLLITIALVKRAERDNRVRYCIFLAITFLYLSLEELTSIHEQAMFALRRVFTVDELVFLEWLIPAMLTAVFFLSYLNFLRSLPARIRRLLIAAGSVYVTGAIGIDALNIKLLDMLDTEITSFITSGSTAFKYALMGGIEEFFEMAGIVIFIYALTAYINSEIIDKSFVNNKKNFVFASMKISLEKTEIMRKN